MPGIQAALKSIKGYSWIKIPYMSSIEQYIAKGDASALAKITANPKGGFSYWGSELAKGLRPVPQWQDDDRRAVHVLAKAEMEDDVWKWVDGQIQHEKEGEDFHGTTARELEVGRKQAARLANDTASWVLNLLNRGKANSAGRYLLSLDDAVLRKAITAANKERSYVGLTGLTELLHQFAPARLDALAEDLLVQSDGKEMFLSVVELLLKLNKEKYAPVIAAGTEARKDSGRAFDSGQALFKAFPDRYRELARQTAQKAFTKQGEAEPIIFLMKTFGKEVLPDILDHFKKKESHYDDEILKAAVETYKLEALPAVMTVLDRTSKAIAKLGPVKPGNYQAQWQLENLSSTRAATTEHLITINDGSLDQRILTELESGLAANDSGGVIAFLALAAKWDLKRMQEKVWGLLEHKSKPVRESAARTLARLGDAAVTRAEPLLGHKKADVRMAAAFLLTTASTPRALEILESRLDEEANDDVRDQMLMGLESAWAKQGRKVTRKDVEKRIARCADKLKAPVAAWVKVEKLPELRWADGGKVSPQALSYLIYRQSRCKEIRPDVEAKAMYDLIDRKSSGDLAKAVLAGFVASKQETGDRWALTVACKLGDDRLVPALSAQVREWVDSNRGKLAEYAVQALALLGSDAALLSVDAMAIRYRSKMKNVGKAAAEAFAGAAEALGISTEELGDRVVPWLGFEPGKPRIVESAGGKFEVSIGLDFKIGYKDLTKNKPAKSLPKSCPAEVLAQLKEVSANLKEAVKSQLLRVENLLVRQRRWPVARWKQLFLSHPLLLPFAVRLVWGHYDDNGKLKKLFRGLEDRTLTTIEDEAYEPAAGQIGMVHPLELDDATKQAWQNHLADYEIEPPFPQLEREVVRVGESEAGVKVYKEHAGKSLNAMTFKGRAEKLGWHRGSVCDGGGITSYVKSFPTAGADVILGVEDFYIGIDMYSDMKLGDVMFVRSGSVTFGSYTYDEPSKEDDPRVLKFGEVPPIVFSEAMGDLAKIAGKSQGSGEE